MSGGGLLSSDLVRAWENYFRQKGGQSPTVPSDVLPVVVLDDNSKGPYPPYRSWMGAAGQLAVAAQFSYCGVMNNDTGKSVVVVDRIICRNGSVDDIVLAVTTQTTVTLGSLASVNDCAEDKDQQPSDSPLMGNVKAGSAASATAIAGVQVPFASSAAQILDGPWTLGPGAALMVRSAVVNEPVFAFFRGRYYPVI